MLEITQEEFELIKNNLKKDFELKDKIKFLKPEIGNKYSLFFLPSKFIHPSLPKELQGITHWIHNAKLYHKIDGKFVDCTGEIKTCEHCQKSKALFAEGKEDEARKLWRIPRYISKIVHNNEVFLFGFGKQINDILIEELKAAQSLEDIFFNPKGAKEFIINVKNKGGFPDYSTSRFTNVRKDLTQWLQ